MKTIDSLRLLHDLETRVETSICNAVETFQNLSTDVLLKRSNTGGWSIAQCLQHLNSYGDFYLPKIQTALKKDNSMYSKSFRSGWIGSYFIEMMLPGSGKKYKAFKKHVPESDLDAAAVVSTFIHQQELLLSYLRIAHSQDLNRIKIPISISPFIKLKLGDVFQFIIAHNERHIEQAKRNLKA
ncbi:DinB family protein [Cytophaga aurantiaca]|uniref:DinB family protein n=1 Tax=Cytophaga aurantiaca TaxID=29530 RepID=UPI000378DE93|nr:DinB family protein [Cytophaga aurantiaca]